MNGEKVSLIPLFSMGRAKRKCVFGHMRTANGHESAQSGQGLHCPLTELLDHIECSNGE